MLGEVEIGKSEIDDGGGGGCEPGRLGHIDKDLEVIFCKNLVFILTREMQALLLSLNAELLQMMVDMFVGEHRPLFCRHFAEHRVVFAGVVDGQGSEFFDRGDQGLLVCVQTLRSSAVGLLIESSGDLNVLRHW